MEASPAEVFFRALYANQTGVLELRTFAPEKSVATPEAEQQRKAAARLRDFILVTKGDFDVNRVKKFLDGCEKMRLGAFFGVALRAKESLNTRKGDAVNCQTLTAIFVDADFKHLGEDETRNRIAAQPKPVSMLVNSGGGLHPYWLLETPIQLQTGTGMARAKQRLRKLARTVADVVDETVSEPVRVLRIPGSYNFKREYPAPRPVVLEVGPDEVSKVIHVDFGHGELDDIEIFAGEVPE